MKKNILITIGIILGFILLDSSFALFFNNNPVIKIKEYYNGGDLNYISKSLFVDTYNCVNGKKDTVIKGFSYSCSNEIEDINKKTDENITLIDKIEIVKNEIHNLNKFNKYLEINNRIIYITPNIKEIYYYSNGVKHVLKYYISKSYQTIDDSLKHVTDLLEIADTYDDGGTTIYKSKEYDITIVKCNTIDKNKNIYIGDFSMNFDSDSMCK